MIEGDGFETVWPVVHGGVTATQAEECIAHSVQIALDNAKTPARALVGVPAYRALLARDGLHPRTFDGKQQALRIVVHGVELVVDCDRRVPDDDAWVTSLIGPKGAA
jgi:hypothetical protein